jgi:FkbM family methyltransferase
MNTYSQIGQDLAVLKKYRNKRNGYFVEIGASDGIKFSNTYLLETQYNWTGICVEALPTKMDVLKKNRPKSICINKAVFNKSGEIVSFDIANSFDMLSGISNYIDKHKSRVDSNKTTISVETITLNDILEQNKAPLYIDYLSIDTEGTEFEILKSVDLTKYKFGLIDIEHNYVEPRRTEIKHYLISNGYKFLRENKWDDSYGAAL